MRPLKLLFGVHNHQPLGNFLDVFERAYQRAYRPFVEIVHEYPEFSVTYHFSGPLLEFLNEHHPEFLSLIREQVERGQAEVVISGYAEPVLAVLPREDRLLQLQKAQALHQHWLGVPAQGLWLTERVFEAEILPELVSAGIRYFVVDDAHFLQVGIPKHKLHGYWHHPIEAQSLAVFPIDQTLRYLIPFRPLKDLFAYLAQIRDLGGRAAIVFDDGEKFGLWPKTYTWVYQKQWLRRFIERVLETDWLQPMTFGAYLDTHPAEGTVYLPSASYFEMNEWALPAEAARRFVQVVQTLEQHSDWPTIQPFLRGGIWKNFLVKYPESARMFGRMLWTRNWIRETHPEPEPHPSRWTDDPAMVHVLRAQCNDAYWHGVFGGIYLPHLRHAIYRELIEATESHWKRLAQRGIGAESWEQVLDLDRDGSREYLWKGPHWTVMADERGGVIEELSWWPARYNFQNTLARHREHYHDLWLHAEPALPSEEPVHGVASIHEVQKHIPKKARRELYFDKAPRVSFVDHLLPKGVSLKQLHRGDLPDWVPLAQQRYAVDLAGSSITFSIVAEIRGARFRIEKTYEVRSSTEFRTLYQLQGTLPRTTYFAVEINWIFPSATSGWIQAGSSRIPFLRRAILKDLSELVFYDASGLGWTLSFEHADRVILFPFYTVSQSEKGVDLICQGHALFLMFLPQEGKWTREVRLQIQPKEENQHAGITL